MAQDGAIWNPKRTSEPPRRLAVSEKEAFDPSLEFSAEAKEVFEKWADELIESGKEVIYPLGK